MTLRRAVLWITGRDLLKPVVKRDTNFFTLSSMNEPNWVMTLSACDNVLFYFSTGPNVIHRFMHRVVLGIHWRMK